MPLFGLRIHLFPETSIHSSRCPQASLSSCFQSKSCTKAGKRRRGKSDSAAADKDLPLKLEPVIRSSSSSSPSSSSHLNGSLLARPPAKNFTCGVCGMQFVRKDSWGSHVRQHERAGETAPDQVRSCSKLTYVQGVSSGREPGWG